MLGGLAAIAAIGIALGFAGATRMQPVAGLALILALAYACHRRDGPSTTAPWRGDSACSSCSR